MWLNKFKIALIQKDADALSKLLDEVPSFEDKKDIEQTMYLIKEALVLMYTLQGETSASMQQIKRNLKFLGSSLSNSTGKFNIRS